MATLPPIIITMGTAAMERRRSTFLTVSSLAMVAPATGEAAAMATDMPTPANPVHVPVASSGPCLAGRAPWQPGGKWGGAFPAISIIADSAGSAAALAGLAADAAAACSSGGQGCLTQHRIRDIELLIRVSLTAAGRPPMV